MEKEISPKLMSYIIKFQKDEVKGSILYNRMAKREKDAKNREILYKIAKDEEKHAQVWKTYTKKEIKPNKLYLLFYSIISFLLGYTFTIKLMEKSEKLGVEGYKLIENELPEVKKIIEEEERHEEILLDILDEERLHYVGAMVLGLNDALVELTGTIAGLTFALAHTRLVALSAIITGVSATLSMAASNYLAERADNNPKALKSSLYTGIAYLITVVLMVLPYLLFPSNMYLWAFVTMIIVVVLIIFVFNYYISIAKSQPFFKRFREMALISLGVTIIAFIIGLIAKEFLGIDV